MAKRVGGRDSAPDPAGGAYDTPPDPLVGWGGDTLSDPTPLSAFGASILALSALNFGVPIVVNLRNDHWKVHTLFISATFNGPYFGHCRTG